MVRLIKAAVIPRKYPRKYTTSERVGQGLGTKAEESAMCRDGKHFRCYKLNCICGCHKETK